MVTDSGTLYGRVAVALAEPQRDHRYVRDRERQQRAERVDADEELEVRRQHEPRRGGRGREDDHVWRPPAPVQPADRTRYLAVGRERVAHARDAEHRRSGCREQSQRAPDRDRVLEHVGEPLGVERLHHAQHGRLDVRRPEGGHPVVNREGADPYQRDPDVNQHNHRGARADQQLDLLAAGGHLPGDARRRLDPGERDHRDRQREREIGPARSGSEVDARGEVVPIEYQHESEHDDQRLKDQVGDRDQQARADAAGADAGEVVDRDECDHRERHPDLERPASDRTPKCREVARDGQRRDRDQDRVVEEDGPAGDEAHELVERVAGEHSRAAALGMHRRSLRIGHHRQPEEQPGDQEYDRRQPVGVARDDPEREVHRADRGRINNREQSAVAEGPVLHVRLSGGQKTPLPPQLQIQAGKAGEHEQDAQDNPCREGPSAGDKSTRDQGDADPDHHDRQDSS